MKSALLAVVAAAFLSSTLAAEELVAGNEVVAASVVAPPPPRYIVLPPSGAYGSFTPSDPPRYAYGWFGAQPRQTWFRHFGYYRNYTQWRLK